MRSDELNSNNFIMYAIKHYSNPECLGIKEFENDLKRFKYIKRLLHKYQKKGVLSERLILNHLILLHNVFGQALLPMLFYKIGEKFWSEIKTFLIFLNYLPENYVIANNKIESNIVLDAEIIKILRKI